MNRVPGTPSNFRLYRSLFTWGWHQSIVSLHSPRHFGESWRSTCPVEAAALGAFRGAGWFCKKKTEAPSHSKPWISFEEWPSYGQKIWDTIASFQSPVSHGFPAMLSGLGRVIHVGANGRKESLRGSAEAWPGPCLGCFFWALLRSSRIELLMGYLSY